MTKEKFEQRHKNTPPAALALKAETGARQDRGFANKNKTFSPTLKKALAAVEAMGKSRH